MPTLTVRNLPEEVHRALRLRAAQHGRSTEAEVRDILETTVRPPQRLRLGTALAELGRRAGLEQEDVIALEAVTAAPKAPAQPMELE
jgi:plasmid stability protein